MFDRRAAEMGQDAASGQASPTAESIERRPKSAAEQILTVRR